MASTISDTPWPIRLTAAEPEKSRYWFPSESHSRAPWPRTAAGKLLVKERRKTEERDWEGAGCDTHKLCGDGGSKSKPATQEDVSPRARFLEPQSPRDDARERRIAPQSCPVEAQPTCLSEYPRP